jgi:hypothetical protein
VNRVLVLSESGGTAILSSTFEKSRPGASPQFRSQSATHRNFLFWLYRKGQQPTELTQAAFPLIKAALAKLTQMTAQKLPLSIFAFCMSLEDVRVSQDARSGPEPQDDFTDRRCRTSSSRLSPNKTTSEVSPRSCPSPSL